MTRIPAFVSGFSVRKRRQLQAFVPGRALQALPRRWPAGLADLFVWGSATLPAGLPPQVRVWRVEDGFLRSVGLGADLVRPMSWVLDPVGIYYDARSPSALEQLLQHGVFDAAERARARAFRASVVAAGLSKYNLVQRNWCRPPDAHNVVLVPGQVETDASIATGTHDVRTNIDLLRLVRQHRPDAWLLYKPHPDVVAGLRSPGPQEHAAAALCNEVLTDVAIDTLLPQVDEVHVMTSLTGFEALLRQKKVFCHGQPFYAGWGLTHDRQPHPRRTRRLDLDELVAGALLRYPVYLSRSTGRPCQPEDALAELLHWRAHSNGQPSWWRRCLRPFLARP